MSVQFDPRILDEVETQKAWELVDPNFKSMVSELIPTKSTGILIGKKYQKVVQLSSPDTIRDLIPHTNSVQSVAASIKLRNVVYRIKSVYYQYDLIEESETGITIDEMSPKILNNLAINQDYTVLFGDPVNKKKSNAESHLDIGFFNQCQIEDVASEQAKDATQIAKIQNSIIKRINEMKRNFPGTLINVAVGTSVMTTLIGATTNSVVVGSNALQNLTNLFGLTNVRFIALDVLDTQVCLVAFDETLVVRNCGSLPYIMKSQQDVDGSPTAFKRYFAYSDAGAFVMRDGAARLLLNVV